MSELTEFIAQKLDDRGVASRLKCAIIPGRKKASWQLLASFGGIGNSYSAKVVQTIAGLYATHKNNTDNGNLGTSIKQMRAHSDTMDRRIEWLMDADRGNIFERVIIVVGYLANKGVTVNYNQLENDLTYWGEAVSSRWAEKAWG